MKKKRQGLCLYKQKVIGDNLVLEKFFFIEKANSHEYRKPILKFSLQKIGLNFCFSILPFSRLCKQFEAKV